MARISCTESGPSCVEGQAWRKGSSLIILIMLIPVCKRTTGLSSPPFQKVCISARYRESRFVRTFILKVGQSLNSIVNVPDVRRCLGSIHCYINEIACLAHSSRCHG